MKTYDPAADSTLPSVPKKRKYASDEDEAETNGMEPKKIKVEDVKGKKLLFSESCNFCLSIFNKEPNGFWVFT